MDPYLKIIDGNSSLAQINREIRGQEIGYATFLSSEIEDGNNTVTFDADTNEVPEPLHILLATDPQPANTTSNWAGDMMVAGKKTAVKSYRRN